MSTVAVDHVRLSQLLADHAGEEPVLPFSAWDSGGMWWPMIVTALMERTAAFYSPGDRYDTGVLRLDQVFVEADSLQWKPKAVKPGGPGSRFRTYKTTAASPETQRAISDRRALADQATKQAELEREESLRRASVATTAEGKEVPTGIVSAEVLATPKTCRVCHQTKPREEVPKTGANARRCYSCAELEKANDEKPIPIKRSVQAKAAKKAKAIPAESKNTVTGTETTNFKVTATLGPNGSTVPIAKTSEVLATSPAGDHYRTFAIEPIQYIEANQLPFHEANVVKYVTRWKLKNGVEDLKKARFYIDRLIELEEAHA